MHKTRAAEMAVSDSDEAGSFTQIIHNVQITLFSGIQILKMH